jgi:hypothetical protein
MPQWTISLAVYLYIPALEVNVLNCRVEDRLTVDVGVSATASSPDVGLDDCVRGRPVPDDRRRGDGEEELCSQEFQDSLVDAGGALHHQEVPDTVDQLRL